MSAHNITTNNSHILHAPKENASQELQNEALFPKNDVIFVLTTAAIAATSVAFACILIFHLPVVVTVLFSIQAAIIFSISAFCVKELISAARTPIPNNLNNKKLRLHNHYHPSKNCLFCYPSGRSRLLGCQYKRSATLL